MVSFQKLDKEVLVLRVTDAGSMYVQLFIF